MSQVGHSEISQTPPAHVTSPIHQPPYEHAPGVLARTLAEKEWTIEDSLRLYNVDGWGRLEKEKESEGERKIETEGAKRNKRRLSAIKK